MGYKKADTKYLTIGFSQSAPIDSTLYYFFRPNNPLTTTINDILYYFSKNAIITRVSLSLVNVAGNYSDEAVTIIFRNGTLAVDTTCFTMTKHAANGAYSYGTANINAAVSVNNGVMMKVTTPAWATNPVSLHGYGVIEYIEL